MARSLQTLDPHSRTDAPLDVRALGEHVRQVAQAVGARVRAGEEAPGFPAPAEADPDHHLWRNGGQWWIAFTAHAGLTQERVRFSLGTADRQLARTRRDRVLRLFAQAPGLAISLRFTPRRP